MTEKSNPLSKENADKTTVGGQFVISLQVSTTRQIQMTGHVYSDDTPAELNARIDAYDAAITRQAIKADIVNKEAQLAAHVANIKLLRDQYAELVKKQDVVDQKRARGHAKGLRSTDLQFIDNYDRTLAKAMENMDALKAAIAEAKKKIGDPA